MDTTAFIKQNRQAQLQQCNCANAFVQGFSQNQAQNQQNSSYQDGGLTDMQKGNHGKS